MQLSRGTLVASIQVDLAQEVLDRFRSDLLDRVRDSGARGVILDVSGLETLDAEEFTALQRIVRMASLMGARSVIAGLRPGVVSALLDSDVDVEGIETALDLDQAFGLFDDAPSAAPEDASAEAPEPRQEPEAAEVEPT